MLMLTRKVGESFTLFHNDEPLGTITLTNARPGRAGFGFEAADSLHILRTELLVSLDTPTEEPAPCES